ncbi:HTH-type transcriptional regulator GltC [compost metagenome]
MDIQQIKYFLALADELHFWNTAAKMNITQSALSRQIQSLESELDLQLFYRDKRNVKLTAAGKFLQEKWSVELNHLNSIQQLAHQIHSGEYGTIRIAHPDSISGSVLPDFIKRVSERFPKLKYELVQLTYDIQEEYLINYKVDLAFSRDKKKSSLIDAKELEGEALCFVVPQYHHFKTVNDITQVSLKNERFILTSNGPISSYNLIIERVIKSFDISPDTYINCEFGSTIMSLVKSGLGLSILPKSYESSANKEVRFIPLPYVTDLYVHYRKDDPNPILKNILEFI